MPEPVSVCAQITEGNILAVYVQRRLPDQLQDRCRTDEVHRPVEGARCVAPGVDQDGNIYINRVVASGFPLFVFDKNGTFLQNARDTLGAPFSRAIDVSKDANDIYFCGFNLHYGHPLSATPADPGFLVRGIRVDTLLKGFDCESIAWNPKTGHLWLRAVAHTTICRTAIPA